MDNILFILIFIIMILVFVANIIVLVQKLTNYIDSLIEKNRLEIKLLEMEVLDGDVLHMNRQN